MGHLAQTQILAQLAEIDQHLDKAPVIGLEEDLQGQKGEDLPPAPAGDTGTLLVGHRGEVELTASTPESRET